MATIMTKDWLIKQCKKYKQYQTPYLNDRLYLQNQGFCAIENLEEFTEVKVVYLECNCIESLFGLQLMSKLSSLFVHKNKIGKIEHLDDLKMLETLDISDNMLTQVENLACCPLLTSLSVANNHLKTSESIEHLKECPNLRVLDLSKNKLEDGVQLLEVLKALPLLSCLYLFGNPCVRNIPNYRKTLISSLPNLNHLDQTPIYWSERIYADAWAKGGDEAIESARDKVCNNIRENERLQFEGMRRLREQAAEERLISINVPLLQFDEDELNFDPIVFGESIFSDSKLQNNKIEEKTLESLNKTSDSFKLKDIDPQSEWKIHVVQETSAMEDENINTTSNICGNDHKFCNTNDLKAVGDNSTSSIGNDVFVGEDKSIISRNKDLEMADTNDIASEETLPIQKKRQQDLNNTNLISKEHVFNHDISDDSTRFLDREDVSDERFKVKHKQDARITQSCVSMSTSNEENEEESIQCKLEKKQKNPMYLYPLGLHNDEVPIPRFLSVSKIDEPKFLAETRGMDLFSQNLPNPIDLQSKLVVLENQCGEEKNPKNIFEIKQGFENCQKPNCTQLNFDFEVRILSYLPEKSVLGLESTQEYDVGKIQGNMPNEEEDGNEKEKLDDEKNALHLDVEKNVSQNVPSFAISTPHSLNFQKIKDCRWAFEDIPSEVPIEIHNIDDKLKSKYEYGGIFHDESVSAYEKLVEMLDDDTREEETEFMREMESNWKDLEMKKDKSNASIGTQTSINECDMNGDFFARLECELMNKMNYYCHSRHQQACKFDKEFSKQSEIDVVTTSNEKAVQRNCVDLFVKEYADEINVNESISFAQSKMSNLRSRELSKVSDFVSNNIDFVDRKLDAIGGIPLNLNEDMSPMLLESLEDLLKEKSMALSRNCALETLAQESDSTLSDATSISDEIDSFYGQFNPIFET